MNGFCDARLDFSPREQTLDTATPVWDFDHVSFASFTRGLHHDLRLGRGRGFHHDREGSPCHAQNLLEHSGRWMTPEVSVNAVKPKARSENSQTSVRSDVLKVIEL